MKECSKTKSHPETTCAGNQTETGIESYKSQEEGINAQNMRQFIKGKPDSFLYMLLDRVRCRRMLVTSVVS